jgi:catechol 2,3-dioxygenase-like lactoylglutathione lyase family enzyme
MATATLQARGIDASYYMTKDLAAATAFYSDLLGFAPSMQVPGVVTEFTFPGGETFGIYQPGADGFYTSGGVMFAVDDVPAFVAAAIARGVTFGDDGHVSDQPTCQMAFGTDPEGNHFIIHKRK